MIVTGTMVSCNFDDDFTEPNVVSLERGPQEVPVDLNGSTTRDVTIYTGNITGGDRTFDINVGGTLNAAAYNIPASVTVPGGSNQATFSITIADEGINPEGETLLLSVAPSADYSVGNNLTLNVAQACDPEFRINFAFDGYASETTWELTDAEGNLVFAGGGWEDGTTTASVMRCINPGEYTFTVFDAYGDGLTYPNVGSVTLLYGGVEIGVIPGNFGEEGSIEFTAN